MNKKLKKQNPARSRPNPIKLDEELEKYITAKRVASFFNIHNPDMPLRLAVMELQWERDFWREKFFNP